MSSRCQGDRGAALIMALAILTLFGVLIGLVLSNAEVGIRTTSVVRSRENKLYGADEGVEHGIEELRRNTTLCAGPNGTVDELTPLALQGRPEPVTVDVTCEVREGGAINGLGWAVITTERSDQSFRTFGANEDRRRVEGPMFLGGMDEDIKVEVPNANVFEQVTDQFQTCSIGQGAPGDLVVKPSPPFHYFCTDAPSPAADIAALVNADFNDPAPPLAPVPHPPPDPENPGVEPECRTFFPGTYTPDRFGAALALAPRNYFVSGTYYFQDVDIVADADQDLVGGAPGPGEVHVNRQGGGPDAAFVEPCDNDDRDGMAPNGSGVKVILGGGSRLLVSKKSQVELFSRCPVAGGCDPLTTGSEGIQGVSLVSVPAASTGSGWAPSTASVIPSDEGSPVLVQVGDQGGNNPGLTFHGLVHVPTGFVDFQATNDVEAQIRGGVVAGRLWLHTSGSIKAFRVTVRQQPGIRLMVVTATARVPSGGNAAVARAVIDLDDVTRKAVVRSWQTCFVEADPPPGALASRSCSE